MEIGANVNPGKEKPQFSKVPYGYLKDMQPQIVVWVQVYFQGATPPQRKSKEENLNSARSSDNSFFFQTKVLRQQPFSSSLSRTYR
jgi:hypothetical protein